MKTKAPKVMYQNLTNLAFADYNKQLYHCASIKMKILELKKKHSLLVNSLTRHELSCKFIIMLKFKLKVDFCCLYVLFMRN